MSQIAPVMLESDDDGVVFRKGLRKFRVLLEATWLPDRTAVRLVFINREDLEDQRSFPFSPMAASTRAFPENVKVTIKLLSGVDNFYAFLEHDGQRVEANIPPGKVEGLIADANESGDDELEPHEARKRFNMVEDHYPPQGIKASAA